MIKKKFFGSDKKLERIEKFYSHFGWKTVSNSYGRLIMSFEKKMRYAKTLKKLFKQAKIIKQKFPSKMIVWAILAALFLVPYFFLKDGVLFNAINLNNILGNALPAWLAPSIVNFLPVFLLVAGSINAMFAVYEVVVFVILKISGRKPLEEIYRIADALSGNVIDAPLEGNVAPDTETSGILEKYDFRKIN